MYIGDKDHWKQIRVGEEIGNPFDEMLWFTFALSILLVLEIILPIDGVIGLYAVLYPLWDTIL